MASPNPCSVELEVMTKNYARLCEILSPVIEDMLPKLISEKVITYENKKNILGKPTGTYKAEALLDDTIKTSLSVGYPDNFYKLLKVMKDTKSSACIQLVDSMIDDGIPSVLVTKFNLRGDGIKSRKSTDHSECTIMHVGTIVETGLSVHIINSSLKICLVSSSQKFSLEFLSIFLIPDHIIQ